LEKFIIVIIIITLYRFCIRFWLLLQCFWEWVKVGVVAVLLAVLEKGCPILDVMGKEEIIKGTMWMVEEDFCTTKLLIVFSISRVANKAWPNINHIWFAPIPAPLSVPATVNFIPLVEIIEGDMFKVIRAFNIVFKEGDCV
jgi:hypothetical protein